MASLFISYSRKDIQTARKLTEAFQDQGLDFWIDWEGIPPTVNWWREIEKGIEETDIFLFLLSPDSSASRVCRQEIGHAIKNGKRLVPIVVRDISPSEAPSDLQALNWIFMRETDNFRAAISKVIKAIKMDYAWAQTHRQLQVKALEWERSNHENSFLLRGIELDDAELQLALNSSKEPFPTSLQREYVLRSRQATNKQRGITTGISIAVFIALAVLAVYGLVQAKLATDRADVALARQLAAQAQSIMATGYSRQIPGILLAVQSMRLYPSVEAAQVLLNNTLPYQDFRMMVSAFASAIDFSPDGKYLAIGGTDNTVRIWEISMNRLSTRMTHDGRVNSVAFSPDGRYVVSGSDDKSARVWDVTNGKEIARITVETPVSSVYFSSNGKYIVLESKNSSTRIWDATTGKEVTHMPDVLSLDTRYDFSTDEEKVIRILEKITGKEVTPETYDEWVNSVIFSPDGKYMAEGGCDKIVHLMGEFCTQATAHVWNVATETEISHLTLDDYITSITFSPDGQYVAAGSQDGFAVVWVAATGREVTRMSYEKGWISDIRFSSDGKQVFSVSRLFSSDLKDIRVWKTSSRKAVTYMAHNGAVSSVAVSPDSLFIISGGVDHTVRLWRIPTGEEIVRMSHDQQVNSVAISPDGKYVVSGSEDHTARVWEASSGQEIARMTHDEGVSSVAFSPDGKYVVSGGCNMDITEVGSNCMPGKGTIRVWEALTGREVHHMSSDEEISLVEFSPNGKYVTSAGCNRIGLTIGANCDLGQGTVRVWDTTTGGEIARKTYDIAVFAVAFSPDSKYVVSGSRDGTARVWEAATGKEIASITYAGFVASAVDFSPDGSYAVSGGCDIFGDVNCIKGSIRVWESTTGKEIFRMTQDEGVSTVAFSADGKYIVSGGCDKAAHFMRGPCPQGVVHVWEASSGHEIARQVHDNYVTSVAFSPDGEFVVSGSSDGTLRAWIYRPENLIGNACSLLTRNLTRDEWSQYIGDVKSYQPVCPALPIESEPAP